MNLKDILELLDKLKVPMGLGIYTFTIESDKRGNIYFKNIQDRWAEVEHNKCDGTAMITLTKELKQKPKEFIRNVLIHELVHMRIHAFNKDIEFYSADKEEDLVNDLVRAIEEVETWKK